MTHHDAWVLFPSDGTLMHAEYDGTADQILTPLYATYEGCHAAWRSGAKAVCTCGHDEPAEYAESYAGGSHGPIFACRHCKAITRTSAFDPNNNGYATGPFEGVPDWVLAYLTSPTRHCLQRLVIVHPVARRVDMHSLADEDRGWEGLYPDVETPESEQE